MNMKKLLALILALCLTVSCLAVSASASELYMGTPDANVITVDLEMEPTTINSMLATYVADGRIVSAVVGALVTQNLEGEYVGDLAESWDVSEDGLTYTFHIRDGLTWSNGYPLTANDFAFAWKTVMTPETGSEYAYFDYNLFVNAEKFYNGECDWEDVGVKVIDDLTLECTLVAPMPYFVTMLGQGCLRPVNEQYYTEVGADKYFTDAEYCIASGPYMVESWTHDAEVVLAKNPAYYDADKISLDKMIWKIYTQSDTRLNAFKAGEVDVIAVTGDQANALRAEGFEPISYLRQAEYHVLFNCDDEYMSNVNLRKAFALAFSRNDFCLAVKKSDGSQPAKTFVPSPVHGYDGGYYADELLAHEGKEELNSSDANPELAVEYLEKALEELGCTREDLSAHITFNTNDSDTAAIQAAFMQEAWRTVLGVEVSVKQMTTKALSAERTNGNFVIDMSGWIGDYDDPMTWYDMWVTGGGNNSVKYSNTEYDECVANAMQETDLAKRQEYFYRCEELLQEDMPICNVYWGASNYAISGKVDNYALNTWQFNFYYAKTK